MARTSIFAAVSLDGFIAADDDTVGPLFDWYQNGDVAGHLQRRGAGSSTRRRYRRLPLVVRSRDRRGRHRTTAVRPHQRRGTASPPTVSTSSSSPTRCRPTGPTATRAPFTFVTDGVRSADRAGEGVRRRPRRLRHRRPDRRPGAPRGADRLRRPQPAAVPGSVARSSAKERWPTRCCSTIPIVQGKQVTHLVYGVRR